MTEEKLVEEILEIASELDRGDITFDEAQIKAQTLVRIDRYEQLIIPDVVKSFYCGGNNRQNCMQHNIQCDICKKLEESWE